MSDAVRAPATAAARPRRYHGGALDLEMIEDVRKLCLALVQARGEAPLSAVTAELAAAGFQQLTPANVHEVLSTLFFDGLVRARKVLACRAQRRDASCEVSCMWRFADARLDRARHQVGLSALLDVCYARSALTGNLLVELCNPCS
jgi:hypothetical protein